jgi:hypothetical protein
MPIEDYGLLILIGILVAAIYCALWMSDRPGEE